MLQRDRIIVLGVMRAVEQRRRALFRRDQYGLPGFRAQVQVLVIPAPELVEFLRIVGEPLPQLGARRDILEPLVVF